MATRIFCLCITLLVVTVKGVTAQSKSDFHEVQHIYHKIAKYSAWTAKDFKNIQVLRKNVNGLFIGTERGLFQLNRDQAFLHVPGFKTQNIRALEIDKHGIIWIGTAGQGVTRIKNGKISHYTSRDGLASNVVQSTFEDSKRRIWISTASGGVHLLENNKIKRLALPAELSNAEMTRIFEDQKKNIWIGTSGAGFISINSENNIKLYKNNLGVSSDIVYAFYEDREGTLWLGTGAGNRKTAYFTLSDPGDYIFEVKADQSGSWSEISKFSFNVLPVFYQTLWFKSALGILLLVIGFFVHKLYSSIHQESILTKLVDERTKELVEKSEKFEIINKQLHASRQQYQSLFFDNPYAVFSFDLAGNFVSANKVTSELTGYSIEELLSMSFVPLIPKDSINEVLEKFIKAGMGETKNYQTKIQTASGEFLYVDVTNLPMTIDGKISGIYGVVKDITEEKFLTDQLALANERFRLANKATSDSIWDWDINTNEIKRDENFLEVKLGYNTSNAENIFESFTKLSHPEEVEKIFNNLRNVLNDKSEDFWEEECRLLKPDYSYAIVYNKGYIIRDDEGQAIRMIGASRDITERKLEEQQLKLMESVITHTTDAVIISKVEGEDLKIIFVNDAFTVMTGYTLADMQCKKSPILRGTKTNPDEFSHFNQAIKAGTAYHSESINYKKNGNAFWVDVYMVPVRDKDGKCSHWVSIERDVTDRKKQMLAIEKQNDQLREIAWTQSHIVRAPLSRIMGVVNLFEDGCIAETEVKEFLQYIKHSGIELDDLIKDIVKKTELVDDDIWGMKNKN